MRSSLALIAAAGVVAIALSGCAAATQPATTSGDSSSAVRVSGEFGAKPRVDFPVPLEPAETQCTETIEGEGDHLHEGQVARVGLSIFSGASGDVVEQQGYTDEDRIYLHYGAGNPPAFNAALGCARDGSRVTVVAPAADAFGEQGNPAAGIAPGESVVIVLDVTETFPSRADGAPRLSRDGFPAVVLGPGGQPGITVPSGAPPASTEVEVLLEGDGEVVESGDQVLVQYTAVNWDGGEVVDSSWQKGTPAIFQVADGEGSQVVPGFAQAVIGQKVGSQVGVIIAPEDGYGEQGSATIPANATLFFVIDILGVL
ncbi:FKBP-type peptidyl-prolyl cis-trans isomerase [Agromyces aerolatus]|uniref:FKBP-type peptidyl-prolyl cis-trans isomerase n=1 Tax=Agromyces sp. LY-1074 TaxID=3074080 RepID=UPI00285F3988|nr:MULTISPECIES: FKBP-type peptidyl-prolyl cis-trans isomerase [unclassified Agromyces]MDR5700090.1 FKBP-type peptidyl-prolyl cis-trans isomerase [Agromyces sp. LY-1074]MDR5706542.1 FKBP-type peptidyl-prolyl cis-trans isomerase [Agromyces sp. LY-1358]